MRALEQKNRKNTIHIIKRKREREKGEVKQARNEREQTNEASERATENKRLGV